MIVEDNQKKVEMSIRISIKSPIVFYKKRNLRFKKSDIDLAINKTAECVKL